MDKSVYRVMFLVHLSSGRPDDDDDEEEEPPRTEDPPSATPPSPAQQQQPPQKDQTPEVYVSDSDSDGSPDVEEAEVSGDDKVRAVSPFHSLSSPLSLSLSLSFI